ncbi:DUF1499 domain-containing protein [Motilimonas pumila]|uniref:DUF1499 domain-containing protein n=2 Tax=Motilimonas pumila TaxID=2303987 RepID=A0A418YDT0_9GAMM|nr:DUF1499 domain-containing protein [Motilimonas pumila]
MFLYSASLLLVITVAFFALIYWQNSQVPVLGVLDGQFKPLKNSPNGVSTQATDTSKRVAPWPWKSDSATTMKAIQASVQSLGNARIVQQESNYLYAVFTTPTMKFHDDVEFWLEASDKTVQFRSQSRAGKSDLGLNQQRYQQLEAQYLTHD